MDVPTAARKWRWWGVLRIVLILLWLIAAATGWWTTPHHQDYAQARADLTAGRVGAYQWGERWDADRSHRWFDNARLESSGTLGPLFMWRIPGGRVSWTDTSDFDEVTVTGAVDEKDYAGTGAVGIAQIIDSAGLESRNGNADPFGPVVTGLGFVLGAVFLGVLVAGPAPSRGTRWFWFWLVVSAPYGSGLLFWLVRDRPWSRSAPPADKPGRRDGGFVGLCIGLLVTFVLDVLLLMVHA